MKKGRKPRRAVRVRRASSPKHRPRARARVRDARGRFVSRPRRDERGRFLPRRPFRDKRGRFAKRPKKYRFAIRATSKPSRADWGSALQKYTVPTAKQKGRRLVYAVVQLNPLEKYRRRWQGAPPVMAFTIGNFTRAEAAKLSREEILGRVMDREHGRGWKIDRVLGLVSRKRPTLPPLHPAFVPKKRRRPRPPNSARGAER